MSKSLYVLVSIDYNYIFLSLAASWLIVCYLSVGLQQYLQFLIFNSCKLLAPLGYVGALDLKNLSCLPVQACSMVDYMPFCARHMGLTKALAWWSHFIFYF